MCHLGIGVYESDSGTCLRSVVCDNVLLLVGFRPIDRVVDMTRTFLRPTPAGRPHRPSFDVCSIWARTQLDGDPFTFVKESGVTPASRSAEIRPLQRTRDPSITRVERSSTRRRTAANTRIFLCYQTLVPLVVLRARSTRCLVM
jgi:hypothetical protein